jgi:hypothetical protein
VTASGRRLAPALARPPAPGAIAARGPARRHPDRWTAWVIVMLARLEPEVLAGAPVLTERLEQAGAAFPLMSARLEGAWWLPADRPGISVVDAGEPLDRAPLHRFDLRYEPPLRVVVPTDGRWLLLCAHHFAFDGLGMAALLGSLLTGTPPGVPDRRRVRVRRGSPAKAFSRVLRPADRVVPSAPRPPRESFAARQVQLAGPEVTARLARACAAAVGEHNARGGRPLRRVGLSVAVGGVGGEPATYRRTDVPAGIDVEGAVRRALAEPEVPPELVGLPPGTFLLRPLLWRLSDTFLVSNLGRLELPGVADLEFYPVARGRSAVAFGAAGLPGRPSTLTVRARDLVPEAAERLLERVVENLGTESGSSSTIGGSP